MKNLILLFAVLMLSATTFAANDPEVRCVEVNSKGAQKKNGLTFEFKADESRVGNEMQYQVTSGGILRDEGKLVAAFPAKNILFSEELRNGGWEEILFAWNEETLEHLSFTGNTGSANSDLATGTMIYSLKDSKGFLSSHQARVECGYGIFTP